MKKGEKLILLSLVVTVVVFSSCNRHNFPDELKAYYPYYPNRTIYFHNDNGETMNFTITDYIVSNCDRHLGSKCPDLSELNFHATTKYLIEGIEKTYSVEGRIMADYSVLFMSFDVTGMPHGELWIENIEPYKPGISSIIGDTITMNPNTIIVRNEGVVQFEDENCIWYLTK